MGEPFATDIRPIEVSFIDNETRTPVCDACTIGKECNGHGEKEGLPTECQYEFEQDMLKHVHNIKSILEKRVVAKKVNREFLNQFLIYDSIEKFKS